MNSPRAPTRASTSLTQADTVKKCRFYGAIDERERGETIKSIAKAQDIPYSTAKRWLHERRIHGDAAYRRTRKLSQRIGRPSKVSDEAIQRLVSPSNPVRRLHYEDQMEFHDIHCHPRTLRKNLVKRANGARRFKAVKVREISGANKKKRVEYGMEHQDKPHEFWDVVYFTDEMHIDPSEVSQEYILREQGTPTRQRTYRSAPRRKESSYILLLGLIGIVHVRS